MSYLNDAIPSTFTVVRSVASYLSGSELGLAGLLFIVVFLVLIIHAYIDTRREVPVETSEDREGESPDRATQGVTIVDRQFAETLLERITVRDVEIKRAKADSRDFFKLKLYIVLRNDTGKDLEARAPTWVVELGDVPSQGSKTPLQVEGKGGWEQDSWLPEDKEIYIPAGRAFRTWIPFDPSLSEEGIRRQHETKRLGILALPVRIVGHDVTLKRRF